MVMATGDIFDASGRLQCSISMSSMVCRRTGTGTTVSRLSGNTNPSSLTVDVSGCAYPIVAISLPGYVAALASSSGTVNQWATNAPIGTAFTYYIFDWAVALPNTNAPVKLFDGQGNCTFNGDFFPMAITSRFTASGQSAPVNGKTYATAQGAPGGYGRPGEGQCYTNGRPIADPGEGLVTCKDIKYQNSGKLYGGFVNNASVGMSVVGWDDVQVSAGTYQTYQQDQRRWEAPITVMAVDVTSIPVPATFF